MEQAFYEACRDITDTLIFDYKHTNECAYHFHGQIEILLVNAGVYNVTMNGVTKQLTKGQLAIADSFDCHASHAETGDCNSTLVTVPNKYLDPFKAFKKDKVLSSNFLLDVGTTQSFLHLFVVMKAAEPQDEYLISGLIQTILGLVIKVIPLRLPDPEAPGGAVNLDFMRNVLFYMNKHLAEDITLDSVSEAFGYSKNYFSTIFNLFLSRKLPHLSLQAPNQLRFLSDSRGHAHSLGGALPLSRDQTVESVYHRIFDTLRRGKREDTDSANDAYERQDCEKCQ